MPHPLYQYPTELLETAALALHALPHRRLRAGTLLASLLVCYRWQPRPEHDLGAFVDDLCRLYSACGPTRALKEAPTAPRQYQRVRLLGLIERALDDQRTADARLHAAGTAPGHARREGADG